MAFYANMAAVATRLLTKYGASTTFTRYTYTTNTGTGAVSRVSSATSTTMAALVPLTEDADNSTDTGTLAVKAERELIAPGAGISFEPRNMDEATIGSVTYRIVSCTPINPAGTPVLYTMGVIKL